MSRTLSHTWRTGLLWPAMALVALMVTAACDDDVGLGPEDFEPDSGRTPAGCVKELTECSGKCINLKSNNQNCGECGNACKNGEVCTEGKCKLVCPRTTRSVTASASTPTTPSRTAEPAAPSARLARSAPQVSAQ